MRVWPGKPYPLGATWDGNGVNFALFSEVADYVELCLVDEDGNEKRERLPEMDGFVHHGYLRQWYHTPEGQRLVETASFGNRGRSGEALAPTGWPRAGMVVRIGGFTPFHSPGSSAMADAR